MYKNNLVATVKSKGKVLREFGDTVFLPFGSEYSIYLKNMNSVRAEVSITIDGQDVLNGSKLVVNANSAIDLERFLESNDKGHKFKFIARTANIEKNRGIQAEDGLIRIEYKYERRVPAFTTYNPNQVYYRNPSWNTNISDGGPLIGASGSLRGSTLCNMTYDSYSTTNCNISAQSSAMDQPGITTKGDISEQKFETINSFVTESESHVIVLQLKGENQGQVVQKPVDVTRKQKCDCCGKINRATSKFCVECGTSLEVLV